ncbi:MAG: dihydroorotase [Gammaproteobacteria bacterium]|nr:dihydroorotase [Gammaproteobacteria bacterium]MYE30869.1 dihydroorotase [Gammaproteobacteria bacterium]
MNRDKLSIIRPDDWHLHLRDHAALATTVPHTARCFRRAIVMPNLNPPVTTVAAAGDYRGRILASAPAGSGFEPLMTLYLTDELPPAEIDRAAAEPWLAAVKYYPAGATTNSESGVTAIEKTYPTLERMQELGVPLLMHGEVNRAEVDIFDREAVFIDEVLEPLVRRFPGLPIVLEHITTSESAEFVTEADARIGATITVHHLLYHRSHMLAGGIRPHLYCLPILKRDVHREALRAAATSGNSRFFLGTDSAPHAVGEKESACGCAGVYTAPAALELYAEVFEEENALDRLEAFAAFHGPDFYGMERNSTRVELVRESWTAPARFAFGGDEVVPIRAGERVRWKLSGNGS